MYFSMFGFPASPVGSSRRLSRLGLQGAVVFCCAAVLCTAVHADVSVAKGTVEERTGYPYSLSGITYAGGNSFYMVADDSSNGENGLYVCSVTLSTGGKSIASMTIPSTNAAVKLSGTYDLEGCAYDPASGNVWIADESGNTVKEYNPATGSVVSALVLPEVITKNRRANFGIESLTISGDGLSLWLCTEEALVCDGERSSYGRGTVVRLVRYVRAGVKGTFSVAAMYAYVTDGWTYGNDVSSKARSGVSGLCALPDGSLLVLERELSFYDDSAIMSAFRNSLSWKLYHVSDFASATDVSGIAGLADAIYTPVTKAKLADEQKLLTVGGNFEGLCLGPRLADGSLSVLLVSDGGDGISKCQIYPLVLSGLDVYTLDFPAPEGAVASITGSNYRFLAGATVNSTVSADGLSSVAYTNDGAKCVSAAWSAPASGASGTGATASFAVSADDTLSWTLSGFTAETQIGAHDTFEECAEGAFAADMPSWSGDGEVVARTYSPPEPPGFAMQRTSHTKVLKTEAEVTRSLSSGEKFRKFDMMICVQTPEYELEPLSDNSQVAVAAGSDGRIYLWHRYVEDGVQKTGWTKISEKVYGNGVWLRVCFEFDYASNPAEGPFCRVRLDGSICPTAHGVLSPVVTDIPGCWHRLAATGASAPSEVVFCGTEVDDLIVTASDYAHEHSGPVSTNGIEFAWFDGNGFPRDPEYPAPYHAGKTVGYVHDAGLDPYDEDGEPLMLKDFAVGQDGRVQIRFNGYKGESSLGGYRVYSSETPAFSEKTDITDSGTMDGDAQTWSTVWEEGGSAADGATPGARFFRVEAVPSRFPGP